MMTVCPYCEAPSIRLAARSVRGPSIGWNCGTAAFGEHTIRGETCALRAKIKRLQTSNEVVRTLANEQADNAELWFQPETVGEAYLQQELRRLHAAINLQSPSSSYSTRRMR